MKTITDARGKVPKYIVHHVDDVRRMTNQFTGHFVVIEDGDDINQAMRNAQAKLMELERDQATAVNLA